MSGFEWAWAGGFLDGEGHFGISRQGHGFPSIQASQSNFKVAPL